MNKYLVVLICRGGQRYRLIVDGGTYPEALGRVRTSALVAVDEVRMSELPAGIPADLSLLPLEDPQ